MAGIAFGQATLFEPGIGSSNREFGLAISPSGENLFFVRAYGGRDSLRIFGSAKINGRWSDPQQAFFQNKGVNIIDPAFSPDGSSILINTMASGRDDYDIFIINKTSSGWSEPERLPSTINTDSHEFYATIASNKNIYFTRRNESNDIYVSQWNGSTYETATSLGGTINTEESESNPFISPNEDFLIFFTAKPEGYGGPDLYISFNENGRWSYPVNLGDKVNSGEREFCPSMDLAGNRFFFSRARLEGDTRIENIYSLPIEDLKIDELRQKAKWAN